MKQMHNTRNMRRGRSLQAVSMCATPPECVQQPESSPNLILSALLGRLHHLGMTINSISSPSLLTTGWRWGVWKVSNHGFIFLIPSPHPEAHPDSPHYNRRCSYHPGNSKDWEVGIRCFYHSGFRSSVLGTGVKNSILEQKILLEPSFTKVLIVCVRSWGQRSIYVFLISQASFRYEKIFNIITV